MSYLNERHNTKIESQSLHGLENAYRKIVDMEVEYEDKLKLLAELKAKIWVEIGLKIKSK